MTPPSIKGSAPVMNVASGLGRTATAAAISAGVATHLTFVSDALRGRRPGQATAEAVHDVQTAQ